MKKIAIAMMLASFSFGAAATATGNVCTGTVAGTATAVGTVAASEFITTAFTPKCSANTFVSYSQSATIIGVGGASVKGKTIFGGSSEGGGVVNKGNCSGTACAQSDASGQASASLAGT